MKILQNTLVVINSTLGLALTLEETEKILGIVILCCQFVIIVYNVISKIVDKVKNGASTKELIGTIEDGVKDMNELKDQLEDLKKDGESNG